MYSKSDFDTAAEGICPGPDLEWFAVDSFGNVAGFTNAGFGPVPDSVFASYELFLRTLNFIYALPVIGSAKWINTPPPIHDTWDTWSERGVFGFDWDHCIGQPDPSLPYRLKTRPTNPIHVDHFPSDVAAYLRSACVNDDNFSTAMATLG